MLRRQFLHFCVAGTLGFLVDAGLVQALVWSGVGPYLARVASVAAAIVTTFGYNRRVTFHDRRGGSLAAAFGRYLLGNAAGLSVNYAAYAGLVASVALARSWPVLAVAAGSLAGMLVNFLAARHFVFVPPDRPGRGGSTP